VRTKTTAEHHWHAACNRLSKGLQNGSLMLEADRSELRFRYVEEPAKGFVLRRGNSVYAAIVEKRNWPMDVSLFGGPR